MRINIDRAYGFTPTKAAQFLSSVISGSNDVERIDVLIFDGNFLKVLYQW